jgi:hypothetical protein
LLKEYTQLATDNTIQTAADALKNRGFTVHTLTTLEDANNFVLGLIPKGSEVFTATSVTLDKSGLTETLNESDDYVSARKLFAPLAGNPETKLHARQLGSASDYAIGSVHAITEDGRVLIASNSGSQLPNYVYGANHVIWVVGAQKIVKNLDEAFDRLENHTLPLEDERAQKAYGSGSVISKALIYQYDPPHRVTILIVKEEVGY